MDCYVIFQVWISPEIAMDHFQVDDVMMLSELENMEVSEEFVKIKDLQLDSG